MDGVGLVLLGIGLLLVVFAPIIGTALWRRWRTWLRVRATVTRVRERKRKESTGQEVSDVWITYRFTDAEGQVRSGTEMVLRRPKLKSELTVRYDPAQPELNSPAGGDVPLFVLLFGVLPVAGVVLTIWGFVRLLG